MKRTAGQSRGSETKHMIHGGEKIEWNFYAADAASGTSDCCSGGRSYLFPRTADPGTGIPEKCEMREMRIQRRRFVESTGTANRKWGPVRLNNRT